MISNCVQILTRLKSQLNLMLRQISNVEAELLSCTSSQSVQQNLGLKEREYSAERIAKVLPKYQILQTSSTMSSCTMLLSSSTVKHDLKIQKYKQLYTYI